MLRPKLIAVAAPLGRSGTSAVMGLLRLAGCNVGPLDKVTRPQPMNPKGFFELKSLNQFLGKLYPGIYPEVGNPPTLDQMREVAQGHHRSFLELIDREFGHQYPIAIKAPRLLILPLLEQLKDRFDARVVLLSRDLEAQIDSIHRVWQQVADPVRRRASRDDIADWVRLWTEWAEEARHWFDLPMLSVQFDRLVQDRVPQARAITAFLEVPTPADRQIAEWLDPQLVNRTELMADPGFTRVPSRPTRTKSGRLFVMADSRSGSNWLIETLEAHDDVTMFKELYNRDYRPRRHRRSRGRPLIGRVRSLLGSAADSGRKRGAAFFRTTEELEALFQPCDNRWVGCKVLFAQLLRWGDILSFLQTYAGARFILLTRSNDVAAEVSNAIAAEYGRWHVRDGELELQSVELNPVEFRRRLEWRRLGRDFVISMLDAFQVDRLDLSYEQLFTDPEVHVRRIAAFLNLKELPEFSAERKANPFKLRDMVRNYDEVKAFLADDPDYAAMLQT